MVASAITDKGVKTASDATFETMASNISSISSVYIGNVAQICPDTFYPSISCTVGKVYVVVISCPGTTNNSSLTGGATQLKKSTVYRSCSQGLYVHMYLLRATSSTVSFYAGCVSGNPCLSYYRIEV